MRARIDLAVDRAPNELVQAIVVPLDQHLRAERVGRVLRHRISELEINIDVSLRQRSDLDYIGEFLVRASAPVGSVIYRYDWLGRKQDIFVLGPEFDGDATEIQ